MKIIKSFTRKPLALVVSLLVTVAAMAVVLTTEKTPGVPNVFNPTESVFQNQTHFLTFIQGFSPESAVTSAAYYNAIDPTSSKRTFQQWLVNAGFISDVSQWHPTGKQTIACDLPGCDLPSHSGGSLVYGDNIINADSHAIVLNAADLGFVRNQFIRCVPSCTASNPLIYTYLENYPVNPFAASGNGGSGFPILTGYPTQAEATAAIESGLTRPLGNLGTNPVYNQTCSASATDTVLGCSIQRIADVAFEWTPAPGSTSGTKYGKQYAFIFSADSNGNTAETITVPPTGFQPVLAGKLIPNFATGGMTTIGANDPFPPNLDFLGFKEHPGVCLICHGGYPKPLTSTGAYPNQGRINGFRFLPLDVRNLMFTSDLGFEATSRISQEPQLKTYNQGVLLTVNQTPENDDTGTVRPPQIAEVIKGWYAGFPGDQTMSSSTQNPDFIPNGWLEPVHGGTAPAGSEQLYATVVSPSCRSCHFNREISLDFGTAANFRKEPDEVFGLAVRPLCQASNPPKGKRPMPLAHLTYQRLWQANNTAITLPSGQPPLTIFNTTERLAQYFGYAGTADWCAKQN